MCKLIAGIALVSNSRFDGLPWPYLGLLHFLCHILPTGPLWSEQACNLHPSSSSSGIWAFLIRLLFCERGREGGRGGASLLLRRRPMCFGSRPNAAPFFQGIDSYCNKGIEQPFASCAPTIQFRIKLATAVCDLILVCFAAP